MDNDISTEEDYHFQGQKKDYCKPKTKVMYIFFTHIFYICVYVHYLAS